MKSRFCWSGCQILQRQIRWCRSLETREPWLRSAWSRWASGFSFARPLQSFFLCSFDSTDSSDTNSSWEQIKLQPSVTTKRKVTHPAFQVTSVKSWAFFLAWLGLFMQRSFFLYCHWSVARSTVMNSRDPMSHLQVASFPSYYVNEHMSHLFEACLVFISGHTTQGWSRIITLLRCSKLLLLCWKDCFFSKRSNFLSFF